MSKTKITMDGLEAEVEEGSTLLEAARGLGIHIPTLCTHEAVEPDGACCVCLVEIRWLDRSGKERSRLVAACTYPVLEPTVVETNSAKVRRMRKSILELLLARSPDRAEIVRLAGEYGITQPRFPTRDDPCILCGLCARVCSRVVGASAIAMTGRAPRRRVSTPFERSSEACLGCGACAAVCPVGAIECVESDGVRSLWKTQFPLARCPDCGRHFSPEKYLEHLNARAQYRTKSIGVCDECRRRRLARELGADPSDDLHEVTLGETR